MRRRKGSSPSPPQDVTTGEAAPAGWSRPGAALVHGLLLLLVLWSFRFQKAGVLRFEGSVLDWLSLLLPELGAVLVVEAALLLIPCRNRRQRRLWWIGFAVVHLLAYLIAAAEHTFYLHSGIRLHLDMVAYAAENLRMLQGLIAYGVDGGFISRLVTAVLCLLLGTLLTRRVRIQKRFASRVALLLVGVVLLQIPPTRPVLRAELDSSTFFELVEIRTLPAAVLRQAQEHQPDPQQLYIAPQARSSQAVDPGAELDPPPALRRGFSTLDPPPSTSEPTRQPPNILLLILESTRWDVIPPLSPPQMQERTPHFHQLAQESWAVETTYASVTHTSKALVGLLCGMMPRLEMAIHETLENALPLSCLPQLLEDAGYRTAFLQTAYGAFENRPGLVRNLGFSLAAFHETLQRPGFAPTGYLGIDEKAMLDPALQWSGSGDPRPFFLTLLTLSPHHPYEVPGGPAVSGVPKRESYDATIGHLDQFTGALLERMNAAGLLENTVVILIGDHGEAFGEHRRMQHDIVPYEEAVRVPWLLRLPPSLGPELAEPRSVGGLRSHLDLMPTILDLAGVSWDGQLPGHSLLTSPGHEAVTSSCWFTDTCLSRRQRGPQGDRKIVYHYRLRPMEVFDIVEDPLERKNLAEDMSEEDLLNLEAQLLGWKLAVDAFWAERPVPDEDDLLWWQRQPPSAPMAPAPAAPTAQEGR
ncbi:MAG: sulfatase-like hydrolase/transferase [Acidobacteriota bacterium]